MRYYAAICMYPCNMKQKNERIELFDTMSVRSRLNPCSSSLHQYSSLNQYSSSLNQYNSSLNQYSCSSLNQNSSTRTRINSATNERDIMGMPGYGGQTRSTRHTTPPANTPFYLTIRVRAVIVFAVREVSRLRYSVPVLGTSISIRSPTPIYMHTCGRGSS